MPQKIKPRHILILVTAIIALASFFLGIFVFQWFIFSQNWLIINAILFIFIGSITFYFCSRKTSASFIGNLANSGIVGLLTFFLTLTLAGGFTFLFGATYHYSDSVSTYGYSFIRSCGYKLTLNEFKPIFGHFCHAGANENDFVENDMVDLTAKESIFGTLITEIKTPNK